MKRKALLGCAVILVIVLGLVFQDNLIRSYVSLCHERLGNYATQILDSADKTTDTYGIWKTSCYPEDGMVEFHTGGWGFAPGSTYKGFYYSADDTHKPFSVAAVSLEINGDNATWTDGTDNHGKSTRVMKNWFWFEASF